MHHHHHLRRGFKALCIFIGFIPRLQRIRHAYKNVFSSRSISNDSYWTLFGITEHAMILLCIFLRAAPVSYSTWTPLSVTHHRHRSSKSNGGLYMMVSLSLSLSLPEGFAKSPDTRDQMDQCGRPCFWMGREKIKRNLFSRTHCRLKKEEGGFFKQRIIAGVMTVKKLLCLLRVIL